MSSRHSSTFPSRLARIGVIVAAALIPFASSPGSVLVNENFDAMRSSGGAGGDATREDPTAAGWRFWNSNTGASYRSITTAPAGMSGQVMRNNSSSEHTVAFIQWSAVSLTEIGGSLSISFDYRALAASAGDPDFEVSFINANPITSQLGGTNPTATASGYGFRQGTNGTYGMTEFAAGTGNVRLLNHETGAPITFNTALYQVNFSLTRVAGGIRMDFSVNGSVISRHLETNPNHTRFNTLRLSSRNSQIDNVLVTLTTAIPEPSTYAALAGDAQTRF